MCLANLRWQVDGTSFDKTGDKPTRRRGYVEQWQKIIPARRAAGGMAAGLSMALPAQVSAQTQTITVADSGGPFGPAWDLAFVKPFEAEFGVKINHIARQHYPSTEIKANVETKTYTWDVVIATLEDVYFLEPLGMLEPLDWNDPDMKELLPEATRPTWAGMDIYTYVLGFRTDKFSGAQPDSWADFWDVKKFPGRRALQKHPIGTLEIALMADGVEPGKLYPLDLDRAFRKLDQIRAEYRRMVDRRRAGDADAPERRSGFIAADPRARANGYRCRRPGKKSAGIRGIFSIQGLGHPQGKSQRRPRAQVRQILCECQAPGGVDGAALRRAKQPESLRLHPRKSKARTSHFPRQFQACRAERSEMVGRQQGQRTGAVQRVDSRVKADVASGPENPLPKTERGRKLSVRGATKVHGTVVALDNASFDLFEGEFLTLLGPSGSGKTTLLMLVAGLSEPTAGEIWIDGKLATYAPPHLRDIGMVFQNYALFPHLTVRENIAFPLRMRGGVANDEIDSEVTRALRTVQLEHTADRLPRSLSGGQQQRIALARCFVYRPSIILMDEPLGALDRKLRDRMQVEISQLHRELGITVLYVTHDQDEAMAMSDRICLMNEGRIEQIGTPEELYFHPRSIFAADFIGDSNLIDVTVESVAPDGSSRLAGPAHASLAAVRTDNSGEGVKARLMVRPERVRVLAPSDVASEHAVWNHARGAVRWFRVQYCVELADGTRIWGRQLSGNGGHRTGPRSRACGRLGCIRLRPTFAGLARMSVAAGAPSRYAALRRSRWAEAWPLYPMLVFLLFFFALPVGELLWTSFLSASGRFSLENYSHLITAPVYLRVMAISFKIAAWTTLFTLIAAYPVAYLLATISETGRNRLILLVLLPFWTSFPRQGTGVDDSVGPKRRRQRVAARSRPDGCAAQPHLQFLWRHGRHGARHDPACRAH